MKISKQITNVVRGIPEPLPNVGSTGKLWEQVIQIPDHLLGKHQQERNWGYPNRIQPGWISALLPGPHAYFIRYWLWDDQAGVFLPELRTLANSELTYTHNLFYFKFFEDEIVSKIVKEMIRNSASRYWRFE